MGLCNRLNLEVVAEEIETSDAAKFLRNTGCHVLQRFYYSNAISADDFLDYALGQAWTKLG